MALPKATARTPERIAAISVNLYSPDPLGDEQAGASYEVQVVHSDGAIQTMSGNLAPHLTTQQTNSLLAFMAAMRTKAEAEILP